MCFVATRILIMCPVACAINRSIVNTHILLLLFLVGRTFFQVEQQEQARGGEIAWRAPIRLRHVTTKMYLSLEPVEKRRGTATAEGSFLGMYRATLVPDNVITDDSTEEERSGRDVIPDYTLFRFLPVIADSEMVQSNAYATLENIATGAWMHPTEKKFGRQNLNRDTFGIAKATGTEMQAGSSTIMQAAGLQWDHASLFELRFSETHFKQKDAISIYKVPAETVYATVYVAGVVPALRHYCSLRKTRGMDFAETKEFADVLNSLALFMVDRGMEIKQRQKLLRDFKVMQMY